MVTPCQVVSTIWPSRPDSGTAITTVPRNSCLLRCPENRTARLYVLPCIFPFIFRQEKTHPSSSHLFLPSPPLPPAVQHTWNSTHYSQEWMMGGSGSCFISRGCRDLQAVIWQPYEASGWLLLEAGCWTQCTLAWSSRAILMCI